MSHKVIVDFNELETCYSMALNHIRNVAVTNDEQSALLLSICKVGEAISSHKSKMNPDPSEKTVIFDDVSGIFWQAYIDPEDNLVCILYGCFTVDSTTPVNKVIKPKNYRFDLTAKPSNKLILNENSCNEARLLVSEREMIGLQEIFSTATGLKNVELEQVVEQ